MPKPCGSFRRFDKKMINITTPSRLHLALIDMNASMDALTAVFGITLDSPVIKISARNLKLFEIIGKK